MVSLDPVVSAILRSGLGLLFLAAAAHKLRDLAAFRATLAEYRVVPARATTAAAVAVTGAELLASLALLAPVLAGSAALLVPTGAWLAARDALSSAAPGGRLLSADALLRSAGGLLAGALLLAYTVAIGLNLARGRRDIDCGCAGSALRQPLGWRLVVRNAVLLLAALGCLEPSRTRPLAWLDAITALVAVSALVALYSAAERLMASAPHLAALRRDLRQVP